MVNLKFIQVFMAIKKAVIICCCFLLAFTDVNAQNGTTPEYQVKAAFLYNFTRFIDWPDKSFSSPDADFIIGIIGENPFGNFLNEVVADEKMGGHEIKIVYFNSITEVSGCHMLYINFSDPDKIRAVLKEVRHHKLLTISDAPNFMKLGGHIRFYTSDEKLRLQINATAAKYDDLEISSKLLSVATIYNK